MRNADLRIGMYLIDKRDNGLFIINRIEIFDSYQGDVYQVYCTRVKQDTVLNNSLYFCVSKYETLKEHNLEYSETANLIYERRV